jgi:hypothetical protein
MFHSIGGRNAPTQRRSEMKTSIVVLFIMAVSNLDAQLIQPLSVTTNATFSGPFGGAGVSLEIQDAAIIASGGATGGRAPIGYNDSWGQSSLSVTFDLAATCSYVLNGQFRGSGTGYAVADVGLSGPSGTVFQSTFSAFGFGSAFATNGVLEAGVYTLTGHAEASRYWFANSADYSATFTVTQVPEPSTCSLLALGILTLLGSCRMPRRS